MRHEKRKKYYILITINQDTSDSSSTSLKNNNKKMNKIFISLSLLVAPLALQAQVAKPMEDVNHVVDLTPDSLDKALTARIPAGSSRKGNNPVLFLVGNSAMRNGTLGNGNNGQWGWGYYEHEFFDGNKITVENQALGGMSSRTFYTKLWPKVKRGIRKGDWVIISIGHNDICSMTDKKARGSIATAKDTCHVFRLDNGKYEAVYSFGWYLKKFIDDVREKGATPILVSLTPRNEWTDGKIERRNDSYGKWYREAVEETGVDFLDQHNVAADSYDKIGKEKAKAYFKNDHTHTSLLGARHNAKCVAKGLKRMMSPLAKYLK